MRKNQAEKKPEVKRWLKRKTEAKPEKNFLMPPGRLPQQLRKS